ncbi:helix-turn-helix domain-containing protein [Turicimonas muris]|uniref:helix-turn-helix domain-containing protein n=1 Tax=Turicimonas muris TaxID=1796652 RepID=UPI003D149D8B
MTVTLSHKIELKANNKFKTYCRKAFGVSRFTWNWALERVNDKRERKEKIDVLELKKRVQSHQKKAISLCHGGDKVCLSAALYLFETSLVSVF